MEKVLEPIDEQTSYIEFFNKLDYHNEGLDRVFMEYLDEIPSKPFEKVSNEDLYKVQSRVFLIRSIHKFVKMGAIDIHSYDNYIKMFNGNWLFNVMGLDGYPIELFYGYPFIDSYNLFRDGKTSWISYIIMDKLYEFRYEDKKDGKLSSRKIQKTYLMSDSNTGMTKIGKSVSPKKREGTLQSKKPTITLFAVCDKNIESELHKEFKEKRVRGEWFDLSKEDLNSIISNNDFKRT